MTGLALRPGRLDGCAHDPKAPRLEPETLRRSHNLARRAAARFAQVYEQRRRRAFRAEWPELLAREKPAVDPRVADFEYRRSERVEALILMMSVLLRHLDFGSSKVLLDGDLDKGLSVERLADEAELPLRRAERALRTLRTAGILSFTEQKRKKVEGCGRCRSTLVKCKCAPGARTELWVADAAVRKITPRFFSKLGHDIQHAYQKLREKLNRRRPRVPNNGRIGDLRIPTRKRIISGAMGPQSTQQMPSSVSEWSTQEIMRLIEKGMPAKEAFEIVRRTRRQE